MFVQRLKRIFFCALDWKNFTLCAETSRNESSRNVTSQRKRREEGTDERENPENATMRRDKCCNREYEVSLSLVASVSPGHGFREEVRLMVMPYVIYTGYRYTPVRPPPNPPSQTLHGMSCGPQSWYAINFAAENPA